MTQALLIEVPDKVQAEGFRWMIHKALREFFSTPEGRSQSEDLAMLRALENAKIVELPGPGLPDACKGIGEV